MRTVLAISLAIRAALGSAVSMFRLQQDTTTPANLQPGSEPTLVILFYFSNKIENVMKLPHNLNFKNNFLGKYVRRQIDKIAKSRHEEIEIRKWQEMK